MTIGKIAINNRQRSRDREQLNMNIPTSSNPIADACFRCPTRLTQALAYNRDFHRHLILELSHFFRATECPHSREAPE